MADATKGFAELLACFRRHGVKSLVVGAHAVAFHAKPRYTKDLDLFVEATPDNARRILSALEEFGFGGIGITPSDFERLGQIVQLGHPPSRVDLMTSIDGVDFSDAWNGRTTGVYGGEPVDFIGRDELLINKKAAARPQDLADLDTLRKFKSSL